MARQNINLGTDPDGIGGDTERAAFVKCNANFTELYTSVSEKLSKSDIVGTIADGAIIEQGNNSIGSWVKFSNGTMIQSFVPWTTPTIGVNTYQVFTVNLPTACSDPAGSAVVISGIPTASNDHYGVTSSQVASPTTVNFSIRNGAQSQQFSMRCNVITRWK